MQFQKVQAILRRVQEPLIVTVYLFRVKRLKDHDRLSDHVCDHVLVHQVLLVFPWSSVPFYWIL